MPFQEWNAVFRESASEFRELFLNSESCSENAPGTLRELREWPFHSKIICPVIGVVPRLLNNSLKGCLGGLLTIFQGF